MSQPLWAIEELVAATGGGLDGENHVPLTGISIDTRSIASGDLFVALQDQRDGHDFVSMAFDKGAGAALVANGYERKPGDGTLIRVNDPLSGLEKIAAAARLRLSDKARVMAVTGSAGKTTTKEMLRLCFAHMGTVHASEKSYNNHWGVPLTLARMPRETDFAVIEIGMNHTGEIRPLSKMTHPHFAIVTSVLPVHLEHFSGIEEIALAKAEIFEGLCSTGTAVIPRDSEQFELLARCASDKIGEQVVSFGEHVGAQFIVEKIELAATRSNAVLQGPGRDPLSYEVGLPGRHNVLNAAACLTAWYCAIGGDEALSGLNGALNALASIKMEPTGRGQVFELGNDTARAITLIDESYNANPASMCAAFENLSLYSPKRRKVAVIGDMLELGKTADDLHAALVEPIEKAGIDVVFACGPHMQVLYDRLPEKRRGAYAKTADELRTVLLGAVQNRDVVMIKGSNGSKLNTLVEAVKNDFSPKTCGGST